MGTSRRVSGPHLGFATCRSTTRSSSSSTATPARSSDHRERLTAASATTASVKESPPTCRQFRNVQTKLPPQRWCRFRKLRRCFVRREKSQLSLLHSFLSKMKTSDKTSPKFLLTKGALREALFCMESVGLSLFELSVARFMRFICKACKPATVI